MPGDDTSQDEAWRELVARYAEPAADDSAASPWPAREELGQRPPQPPGDPVMGPLTRPPLPGPDPVPGPDPAGETTPPGARAVRDPGPVAGSSPDSAGAASGERQAPGHARIIRPASPVPPPPGDDDHYVPPPPPPLPHLDPVAKGAWAALFGGPGYLLLAVMAGWTVSGTAAFIAVAAFVAGFATLVARMGDRPPRDSGPDDGAVV
jgi:hypothetical protein